MYKTIIIGTAANLNNIISNKERANKMYLKLFFSHDNDLNFNEKSEISETNKYENPNVKNNNIKGCVKNIKLSIP